MGRKKQGPKPKTEELLVKLEKEYLETRDIIVYQRIFQELLPYAKSLILKKTKGKIFLPPALVEDAALESTIKFMSQYEKPGYFTRASFAGLLSYKILESLYGPKIRAADRIVSLNEHIENGKSHETELGDLAENYNFTYLFRPYNNDIVDDPANYLFDKNEDAINSILTVLKDVYKNVPIHSFFLISMGIYQFIEKSKTLQKFKELFFTSELENIYELSLLEIRNRLANTC